MELQQEGGRSWDAGRGGLSVAALWLTMVGPEGGQARLPTSQVATFHTGASSPVP